MGFVIAAFVAFVVLCLVCGLHRDKYGTGRKVKVQFKNADTGRTIHAGNGTSIGSAITDGFSKMWNSVSMHSHEDTLRSKLDVMERTLSENRSRMYGRDITQCEHYIYRMRDLLTQKEAEQECMQRDRLERIKSQSERKRYIAEQRRIVTASMRYDVMRRDNFRCVLCGASQKDGVTLHVDHIIPLAKGGKSEMSNLRTLCDLCNLGKGVKIEAPLKETTSEPKSRRIYRDTADIMQELRILGVVFETEKTYSGYAIVSSPDVDRFMDGAIAESGKLVKMDRYGKQIWTIQ